MFAVQTQAPAVWPQFPWNSEDNPPEGQPDGAAWCCMYSLQNYKPLLYTKSKPQVFSYSNKSAVSYLMKPLPRLMKFFDCFVNPSPGRTPHCLVCNVPPRSLPYLPCISYHLFTCCHLLGSSRLTPKLFSGWYSKYLIAVSDILQLWFLFWPTCFLMPDTLLPGFSWGDGNRRLFSSDKALITRWKKQASFSFLNQRWDYS